MAPGLGEFEQLKADCIESGRLYEDTVFRAVNSSISYSHSDPGIIFERPGAHIVWKRPGEICSAKKYGNPRFVVDGISSRDLHQGSLGDCWFLAAAAVLATRQDLFDRVVPRQLNFDTENYGGIFHFNFWQYGKWKEVIVDDRLPTINGVLIFCQNRETPNEFWSALMEKAYAKLYGSYEALRGGHSQDALVDFTGGIGESIALKKEEDKEELFQKLKWLFANNFFLCASVPAEKGQVEPRLESGLIGGHAYSITSIIEIPIGGKVVRLIRLRNPWGETEWNGDWSDKSPEWNKLSAEDRNRFQLKVEEDGEFWMSYEDFTKNFDEVEICIFTSDSADAVISKDKWTGQRYNGAWVRGLSAGGCVKYPATFWDNPHFLVDLQAVDEQHKKAWLVVSLMQKNARLKRTIKKIDKDLELTIGLYVCKYRGSGPLDVTKCQNLDRSYFDQVDKCSFTNLRERSGFFQLDPGVYCIVPCTYDPNQECDFFLRIATERPAPVREVEDETRPTSVPLLTDAKESTFEKLYAECSGDDDVVDARELRQLLNKGLKRDVDSEFSSATIRALIQAAAGSRTTVLREPECRKVWQKVILMQEAFVKFDKDLSGKLDTGELQALVASVGIHMTKRDLVNVVRKFCAKSDQLSMDEFVLVAAKATFTNELFRKIREGSATSSDSTISLTQSEIFNLLL